MSEEIIDNEEQTSPPVIEKVSISEIKDEQDKVAEEEIENLINEALKLIHDLSPEDRAILNDYINKK